MAPIVIELRRRADRFLPLVCVTGQHRRMLDQVLVTFGIVPDMDLSVMTEKQGLSSLTARVLTRTDEVLAQTTPDIVFVQGDTTTAMAGSLSAFYHHIPVAHVEAGLRTGDFLNPFPEEANRVLIDRLASLCFAPTEGNRCALLAEGIPGNRVFVTGNTGIDALRIVRNQVQNSNAAKWVALWGSAYSSITDRSRPLALITVHRRESLGVPIEKLFRAILHLARGYPEWSFVYPVHLNPNVKGPATAILSGVQNVYLIEPLPYEPFVYLMDRATLILTDSGGIQEEAASLGKLVLVLRATTERQEALDAGNVILAGNDGERLASLAEPFLRQPSLSRDWQAITNLYGNGHAAEQIIDIAADAFESGNLSLRQARR